MAPAVILVCPLVPNDSQKENYGVKPNKTVWYDELKGEHDR